MSNWRTDYPRNVGLNRIVNEEELSAAGSGGAGGPVGSLSMLSRLTANDVEQTHNETIQFDLDVIDDGSFTNAAGVFTCVVPGTYMVTCNWGTLGGGGADGFVAYTNLFVNSGSGDVLILAATQQATILTGNNVNLTGPITVAADDVVHVETDYDWVGDNFTILGDPTNNITSISFVRVA